MKVSGDSFGLVIAFLLPGFICLWGLSFSMSGVDEWLAKSSEKSAPTVGGFFYSTLASLSLGLLISAIRWAFVDFAHRLMGVREPELDFSKLTTETSLNAYQAAVEAHYRYYQYYANTFVGLIISFFVYYFYAIERPEFWFWIIFILTAAILFLGSRDSLIKYYKKSEQILGTS